MSFIALVFALDDKTVACKGGGGGTPWMIVTPFPPHP